MQMFISFSQSSDERWAKSAEINVRPFYRNNSKKFCIAKRPVVVREPSLSGGVQSWVASGAPEMDNPVEYIAPERARIKETKQKTKPTLVSWRQLQKYGVLRHGSEQFLVRVYWKKGLNVEPG